MQYHQRAEWCGTFGGLSVSQYACCNTEIPSHRKLNCAVYAIYAAGWVVEGVNLVVFEKARAPDAEHGAKGVRKHVGALKKKFRHNEYVQNVNFITTPSSIFVKSRMLGSDCSHPNSNFFEMGWE